MSTIKNKKNLDNILILGGAGFIGHLAIKKILESTDWELLTFDRLSYAADLRRIDEVVEEVGGSAKKRIRFIFHDLNFTLLVVAY